MHIIVLGGGIIGTTTAYYLARDGHRVTVVERRPGVGLETSFANGGLVTPSMSDPWAAPGVPTKIMKWLGKEDAPLLLRLHAVPGLATWGLRFLGNCKRERWQDSARAVLKLGLFSRYALDELTDDTGLAYDRRQQGTLRLFRDPAALQAAQGDDTLYRFLGLPHRFLDAAGCMELEPALQPVAGKIVGGVHFPGDSSGDAYKFTEALAARARALGVDFRFDTTVTKLVAEGDRLAGLRTDRGPLDGDGYVLALGSYSPQLARGLRLRLPVYPVKGYSATLPVGGWNGAPGVPIMDDTRKMGIARLGDQLRLAGTVEFTGYDTRLNERRGAMLLGAFAELFPGYPDPGRARHWAGLRPMTPDGRPILGPSPYRNLLLNTGHGPLGWTQACCSAKLVAALVGGRAPELDMEDFALTRFR